MNVNKKPGGKLSVVIPSTPYPNGENVTVTGFHCLGFCINDMGFNEHINTLNLSTPDGRDFTGKVNNPKGLGLLEKAEQVYIAVEPKELCTEAYTEVNIDLLNNLTVNSVNERLGPLLPYLYKVFKLDVGKVHAFEVPGCEFEYEESDTSNNYYMLETSDSYSMLLSKEVSLLVTHDKQLQSKSEIRARLPMTRGRIVPPITVLFLAATSSFVLKEAVHSVEMELLICDGVEKEFAININEVVDVSKQPNIVGVRFVEYYYSGEAKVLADVPRSLDGNLEEFIRIVKSVHRQLYGNQQ